MIGPFLHEIENPLGFVDLVIGDGARKDLEQDATIKVGTEVNMLQSSPRARKTSAPRRS